MVPTGHGSPKFFDCRGSNAASAAPPRPLKEGPESTPRSLRHGRAKGGGSNVKHKLTNRWGIQLLGHEFDLADWLEALKPPFDPYVEFHAEQHVLRWSGFEACQTAV